MSPIENESTVPLAGVIGSPISHSRSPAIMKAAFAATDLAWEFYAFDVGTGEASAVVDALRVLRLRGFSVTMPLKREVIPTVDRITPAAEALGAVNCIAWEDDELVGHNTDGDGFLDSLVQRGVSLTSGSAAVVGAGGAARAVIRALGRAGSPEVIVVNRSVDRASEAVELAGGVGRVGSFDDLAGAQLVVNATSVGMAHTAAEGKLAVPPDVLNAGQVVVDIVYNPLRTPLLVAAEAMGATTIDGLGMLTNQAARAFSLWTGLDAPIAAMSRAARHTL